MFCKETFQRQTSHVRLNENHFSVAPRLPLAVLPAEEGIKKPAHASQTKARRRRNWRGSAFRSVVLTLAESQLRGNGRNIRVIARRPMMAFPLLSLLFPQSTSTSRGSRHPTMAWSQRTWTRSCWTRRWSPWIRTLRSPTLVGKNECMPPRASTFTDTTQKREHKLFDPEIKFAVYNLY